MNFGYDSCCYDHNGVDVLLLDVLHIEPLADLIICYIQVRVDQFIWQPLIPIPFCAGIFEISWQIQVKDLKKRKINTHVINQISSSLVFTGIHIPDTGELSNQIIFQGNPNDWKLEITSETPMDDWIVDRFIMWWHRFQ